jgi:hypothetical protein
MPPPRRYARTGVDRAREALWASTAELETVIDAMPWPATPADVPPGAAEAMERHAAAIVAGVADFKREAGQ